MFLEPLYHFQSCFTRKCILQAHWTFQNAIFQLPKVPWKWCLVCPPFARSTPWTRPKCVALCSLPRSHRWLQRRAHPKREKRDFSRCLRFHSFTIIIMQRLRRPIKVGFTWLWSRCLFVCVSNSESFCFCCLLGWSISIIYLMCISAVWPRRWLCKQKRKSEPFNDNIMD